MTLEASAVTPAVPSAEAAPSGHKHSGRPRSRPQSRPQSKRGRQRGQKRKLPAGIVIVLGLMTTGFLWAAFAPAGRAADSAAANEQVRLGRALFLAGCSSCHGLDAQGGNQAPSLIGVGAAAVDFQVSTGRMPLAKPQAESERHSPKYNQTQIDQLAAYIASIAPGPKKPDAATVENGGQDRRGWRALPYQLRLLPPGCRPGRRPFLRKERSVARPGHRGADRRSRAHRSGEHAGLR